MTRSQNAIVFGVCRLRVAITYAGMTGVFVPRHLEYMGVSARFLHDLNPCLIPLITHNRAGFGGRLFTTSLTVFFCLWCGRPSRSLWQVLTFAGTVGFITAVGIHPVIGYLSLSHLAPAAIVSIMFLCGIALCHGAMVRRKQEMKLFRAENDLASRQT